MAEQQLTTNAHSRVSGQLLLRHHTSLALYMEGEGLMSISSDDILKSVTYFLDGP